AFIPAFDDLALAEAELDRLKFALGILAIEGRVELGAVRKLAGVMHPDQVAILRHHRLIERFRLDDLEARLGGSRRRLSGWRVSCASDSGQKSNQDNDR